MESCQLFCSVSPDKMKKLMILLLSCQVASAGKIKHVCDIYVYIATHTTERCVPSLLPFFDISLKSCLSHSQILLDLLPHFILWRPKHPPLHGHGRLGESEDDLLWHQHWQSRAQTWLGEKVNSGWSKTLGWDCYGRHILLSVLQNWNGQFQALKPNWRYVYDNVLPGLFFPTILENLCWLCSVIIDVYTCLWRTANCMNITVCMHHFTIWTQIQTNCVELQCN